jgi:hypothetical protein
MEDDYPTGEEFVPLMTPNPSMMTNPSGHSLKKRQEYLAYLMEYYFKMIDNMIGVCTENTI